MCGGEKVAVVEGGGEMMIETSNQSHCREQRADGAVACGYTAKCGGLSLFPSYVDQ